MVMIEAVKQYARLKLFFCLQLKGRHKSAKRLAVLRRLAARMGILVYRLSSWKLNGPCKFISVKRETIFLLLHHGRRIYQFLCGNPLSLPIRMDEDSISIQNIPTDTIIVA